MDEEIIQFTARIESRQIEIDSELDELRGKIKTFTGWAWTFVWIGIALAILSIIYFFRTTPTASIKSLDDFMSGAVAAVWSLAGLFFIYVAFLGQKQQLLNQQIEIMYSQLEVKHTRQELAGQKQEMIEQNQTLKQQKFENTYFQLLSLFSSIVNSMDLRNSRTKEITTSGRDCFEVFYKRLNNEISDQNHYRAEFTLNNCTSEEAVNGYEKLYDSIKSDMSHYFRTFYHIIKFIENSDIENKKQYVSMARAQLSSYEQLLLFYNCLHQNGVEKFKPLIEKYALFKNLDRALLINPSHINEYKPSAYS
jgi:hypothetical protein